VIICRLGIEYNGLCSQFVVEVALQVVYSKTDEDARTMWIAGIWYDINFVVAMFEAVVGIIISVSTGYNKLARSSGRQGLYDD